MQLLFLVLQVLLLSLLLQLLLITTVTVYCCFRSDVGVSVVWLQDSLLPAGPEPTLDHAVVCRARNAFRLVAFEDPGGAVNGPMIKVCMQLLLCGEDTRQTKQGLWHT